MKKAIKWASWILGIITAHFAIAGLIDVTAFFWTGEPVLINWTAEKAFLACAAVGPTLAVVGFAHEASKAGWRERCETLGRTKPNDALVWKLPEDMTEKEAAE